mmetsp:Transcript_5138/g.14387  ORF Transcript_5138/g.14387 Transcript_5138/m.14387 type:complete len:204 (-) Transcript_5138:847-1458(-)
MASTRTSKFEQISAAISSASYVGSRTRQTTRQRGHEFAEGSQPIASAASSRPERTWLWPTRIRSARSARSADGIRPWAACLRHAARLRHAATRLPATWLWHATAWLRASTRLGLWDARWCSARVWTPAWLSAWCACARHAATTRGLLWSSSSTSRIRPSRWISCSTCVAAVRHGSWTLSRPDQVLQPQAWIRLHRLSRRAFKV